MNTTQNVSTEQGKKYSFTVDPEVQAQNRAAHDAKKNARSAAKIMLSPEEALRLDRLHDIERNEREAREVAAPKPIVKVVTECTLSDEEREESRKRAEAEAEAARHLIEDGRINVVKVAPEIAPEVFAAGLAADRAEDARRRLEQERREAEAAERQAHGESLEAERVRRLAETLPEDIAREAERTAEEKAEEENRKDILARGLLADKEATARSRAIGISKSDMSQDEKHEAMLEAGFVLGAPASSERDARYTHRKLGFSFYLRGTALGVVETIRPKKPRGSELIFKSPDVSDEEREMLREKNRRAHEEREAERKAANKRRAEEQLAKKEKGYKVMPTKVKTEKKPDDGKKNKRKG